MQPNRIDSVYGYLTPKRFLSTLMNPSNKAKSNKSMLEHHSSPSNLDKSLSNLTSPPRKQRQSYRKKMSQDPQLKNNAGEGDNFNAQRIERFNTMQSKLQIKSIPDSQSPPANKQTNGDYIMIEPDHQSIRMSSHAANPFNKQRNEYQEKEENVSRSQIVGFNKKLGQGNAFDTKSRKFSNANKKNAQISQLVINQIIGRLINIKTILQQEIFEFKILLDETNVNIQFMDAEYQKFKQKILIHTSQALDSAFKEYKKNLPNWAVYESVEQSGFRKIAEISQTIQICQDPDKFKSLGGKQGMQKRIQQFGLVIQQVKDARFECNSQRPFISEERIKKLEGILRQIGKF